MKSLHCILYTASVILASPLSAVEPIVPVDPQASGAALGSCIVAKSTGEDRLAVARWMIGAIASAPQLADMAKVDAAAVDAANRKMATLFTRLLLNDCWEISQPLFALKDSSRAFETAGEALGGVAMQELLANKAASAGMEAFTKYIDQDAFDAAVAKSKKQAGK